MARFRLTPADHERYGDRWYSVDVFNPGAIDAGILEAWEEATGYLLFGDFTDQLGSRSIKALRAMCFLAYLIAGGELEWDDFKPQVHMMDFENSSKAAAPKGEAKGPNRATRRAATPSKRASRSATTSKATK